MTDLLSIAIVPVLLTMVAFQIGLLCQKKFKSPIFNPILIGVILVILTLKLTGMEVSHYQSGVSYISWLMTPATICLAVPMYEQIQALRRNLKAILVGVAAGAVSCIAMVLGLCLLLHLDQSLTISLLPKSVTAAIGVPMCELLGGTPSLTTVSIAVTGIIGNMLGTTFCKWFGITHPVAQGVAFGVGSHVIGTTKATELNPLTGAVSSLSLVVAGLLTAVVLPLVVGVL